MHWHRLAVRSRSDEVMLRLFGNSQDLHSTKFLFRSVRNSDFGRLPSLWDKRKQFWLGKQIRMVSMAKRWISLVQHLNAWQEPTKLIWRSAAT
jgi:hypothetical protein